jgi:hypothetical protein
MYEGRETVLAPSVTVVQAALARLRSDRCGAKCEGAGRVL